MLNLKDPFVSTLVHAFIGAFLGAIGGLIMFYFILLIGWLLPPSGTAFGEMGELADAVFPAMSMGSVVGTILAGVAGLRKTR